MVYIPLEQQVLNLLLPHEYDEDEDAQHGVAEVGQDPEVTGSSEDPTYPLGHPVDAHDKEQL